MVLAKNEQLELALHKLSASRSPCLILRLPLPVWDPHRALPTIVMAHLGVVAVRAARWALLSVTPLVPDLERTTNLDI